MILSLSELFQVFFLSGQGESAGVSRGGSVFLLLFTVIVLFLIYWFPIESKKLRDSFSRHYGEDRGSLYFFIFNKLWGSFWFGIVGTFIAFLLIPFGRLREIGFVFPPSGDPLRLTLFWSLVLLPPAILLTFFKSRSIAKKGGDFGRYPEIGAGPWGFSSFFIHIFFWSLYLLAYELMFRGYLLFLLIGPLGPWPAIGINIALYSAVHVPKGPQEAIGALFLGFLLCLVSLQTGNILVAFTVHVVLAVMNGIGAVIYRKDIHITFLGRKN